MPEAILKFKLPEERGSFSHAKNGADYWSAMVDFREWLCEQGEMLLPDDVVNKLNEFLSDRGIIA
jgi:hypothetical protein